ncbi:MAG: hypothetical protein H6729_00375 [Deltaproteobacteria bacterium]|nr:hypothetical protein [Deltaproteobacteria bacterium]
MEQDTIDYHRLVQESLRQVVRSALLRFQDPAKRPPHHHFYITFKTQAPGVTMSRGLRAKYPEDMTIVLRHQFEDLTVIEEAFSVTLYFQGSPEHLVIPFKSITRFYDPSVEFALIFEVDPAAMEADAEDTRNAEAGSRRSTGPRLAAVTPLSAFSDDEADANADSEADADDGPDEADTGTDATTNADADVDIRSASPTQEGDEIDSEPQGELTRAASKHSPQRPASTGNSKSSATAPRSVDGQNARDSSDLPLLSRIRDDANRETPSTAHDEGGDEEADAAMRKAKEETDEPGSNQANVEKSHESGTEDHGDQNRSEKMGEVVRLDIFRRK